MTWVSIQYYWPSARILSATHPGCGVDVSPCCQKDSDTLYIACFSSDTQSGIIVLTRVNKKEGKGIERVLIEKRSVLNIISTPHIIHLFC